TARVPGQAGLDRLEDLAAERRLRLGRVAAMAGPGLQRRVGRVARGLPQAEAVDRGAEDPRLRVGPIGLGVVVGGLTGMAGGAAGVSKPGGGKARFTGRWCEPVCSMATIVSRRPCSATARRRWSMAAPNPERVCSTGVGGMRTRP